jgi:hypothetical protein
MALIYQLGRRGPRKSNNKCNKSKSNKAKLEKIDVLVLRFNASGQLGDSRPCAMCTQRLIDCGFVRLVHYSNAAGGVDCFKPEDLVEGAKYTSGYRRKFQASMTC